MNELLKIDWYVFRKINAEWVNSFADWFFPAITDLHRDPRFLALAGSLLFYWLIKSPRRASKWIAATILCVGAADLISYQVIKLWVNRPRPEFTKGLEVILRTSRHSGPSFPSNHAANIFAAATMLSGAIEWMKPLFYLFALAVAYSRVYVGVHFPSDVLAGAALGIFISATARTLFTHQLDFHFTFGDEEKTERWKKIKKIQK
jgi:undecaprenyl-diphosphatase